MILARSRLRAAALLPLVCAALFFGLDRLRRALLSAASLCTPLAARAPYCKRVVKCL